MPPMGFEPTVWGGERPQTYVLDRAATGTGILLILFVLFHDYYNLHIFACMDASFENVCTAILGIKYTAYHILGRKHTTPLR